MRLHRNRLDPDLAGVDAELRRHRPVLADAELAAMAARAIEASPASPCPTKEAPMRFRVAVVSLLALGFALSGGGVGLAVSGLVGSDNASSAQYGSSTPPRQEVLGEAPTTGGGGGNGTKPGGGFENGTPSPSPAREQGTQAPRQLSQGSGSSLPFTGWATVPVILAGLALLASGLVLRRRTA
jgi:hypothetical protein